MTETAFRTFGGLLGLVGVLLVAYELDAAIGQYSPMHSAVRRTGPAPSPTLGLADHDVSPPGGSAA